MAIFSLGKAREKVKEKKQVIQQLDRMVRRMEGIMVAEEKVKEEGLEDEVVEVKVEGEEMVEQTVKGEVEEKVVEEKAVGGGGGSGRGFFWGLGMRGPSNTCHGTRPSRLAPTPQTWTTPFSSPRRVRFGLSGF